MSSDPGEVLDALERAQETFEGVGFGIPEGEEGISIYGDYR